MGPGADVDYSDTNQTNNATKLYIVGLQEGKDAYIVPIVFGIIFLVGVIGNGTTIFTVLMNKAMRNVPNIYIVSLACGDLILILIAVPCSATIYTFIGWPHGLAMCKINYFLQTMSLGVSVFTLVALAGDRYTAIVNPMRKHMGNPIAKTVAISISIWLISILLAIMDGVAAEIEYSQSRDNKTVYFAICEYYPMSRWSEAYAQARAVFRFIIYFALPVLIISSFYILIARILIRSSYNIPGEGKGGQLEKQIEARKKVAIVVLLLVLVFIICWLPRHVFTFWYQFDPAPYNEFWHAFKVIGFCLSFINSCINPITLYFLSKQFRKYFNYYLTCAVCRVQRAARRDGAGPTSASMYQFTSTVRRTSTTMTMLPQSQSM